MKPSHASLVLVLLAATTSVSSAQSEQPQAPSEARKSQQAATDAETPATAQEGAAAPAQDATAAPATAEQLEQLVAPIALYPDALLAQLLMASTYPLEIVEAARWVQKNPKVTGEKLEAALQEQTWDPSVKSLCGFPDVLKRMNENLDWTQALGDAFLAQKSELMDSMQTITLSALATALLLIGCSSSGTARFATPDEAMERLLDSADDKDAAEELLGAGGFEMLSSGDVVADRKDFERVVELAREQLAFEDVDPDRKLALFGSESWEFPIPLVREDGLWRFDVEAGREEILNRRVGRNELLTLETLRAMVQAQRGYARQSDGRGPGTYATRVLSSEGKRDGLYWPVEEGEPESPLGPFVAEAFEEGYRADGPIPYHGYNYRLLTGQGPSAPGGARSYLDEQGELRGGFGVIAWPATYGNSGVMTFIVNQQGIVFERDLGPDTAQTVKSITTYHPDDLWTPDAG